MVWKVIRWISLLGLTVLVLLVWGEFGGVWWAEQSRTTVIDAESKRPVAEAIVLANWELKGLEGWPMEQIALREVTTDAQGGFVLPGWGPELRLSGGAVRSSEPTVRIYRSGYLPVVIRSKPAKGLAKAWRAVGQRSLHDRDVIELQPLHGSLSEQENELRMFQISINFLYSGANCDWKRAPRMVTALSALKSQLRAEGHETGLVGVEDVARSPKCGDPREVLKEYIR